jgi:hypothetical protein
MLYRVDNLPQLECKLFLVGSDLVQCQDLLAILLVYTLLRPTHFYQVLGQLLARPLKHFPHVRRYRALDLAQLLFNQIVVSTALLDIVWQVSTQTVNQLCIFLYRCQHVVITV